MPQVEEFLNPQSMITPGIAGSLTMAISNTLALSFSLPRAPTGFFLSFVFALVVLTAHGIPLWQRGVYYFLNGLIIFSVAIGANAAGSAASKDEVANANSSAPTRVLYFPTSSEQASRELVGDLSPLNVEVGADYSGLITKIVRASPVSEKSICERSECVTLERSPRDTNLLLFSDFQTARVAGAYELTLTTAPSETFFGEWFPVSASSAARF